jgi:hypothetical protein
MEEQIAHWDRSERPRSWGWSSDKTLEAKVPKGTDRIHCLHTRE